MWKARLLQVICVISISILDRSNAGSVDAENKRPNYANISCSFSDNTCASNIDRCNVIFEQEQDEKQPKCYCDQYCSELNDCCLDYASSCRKPSRGNKSTKPYAAQARNWKCYKYNNAPRSPGVWMVSSCPLSFRKNNNTRDLCEASADKEVTSQMEDLLSNIPVTSCYKIANNSTCVTFRNIYCARCNSAQMVSFWDVKWRCDVQPSDNLNHQEKIRFLLQNCPGYNITPRINTLRRYCYPVVTNCSMSTDSKLVSNCAQGPVGLVYDEKKDKHFKNPSCLLCNGGNVNQSTCGPSDFSKQVFQPKSFEMVLQFQSFPWGENKLTTTTESKQTCGKELVYDKYLEECRVGIVPDPLQSLVNTYRIKAWLRPILKTTDLNHVDQSSFLYSLAKTLRLPTHVLSMVSSRKDKKVMSITFDVKAIPFNQSYMNASWSFSSIKKLIDFQNGFNISVDGIEWNVFKIIHRLLTCSRPTIYPPSNFTSNNTHVIINNRMVISTTSNKVHFITQNNSIYGVQAGSLFLCASVYSTPCLHGQVLLLLQPHEFTLQNGSLTFIAAKTTFESSQFELHGQNAWVCTNYTNITPTEPVVHWASKFGSNQVLWYFTVCGLSLSIVCLFTLLVTYFIFKELRTMPGKNLMSLTISLLLSHFTWLLGSGDTHSPVFCRSVAVSLHYLFLVSFACTTVIAYDTRRAFPKNSNDMSNALFSKASKKRFFAYIAFSWGVPFVFVVTCVIIDQEGQVVIGYGNALICWLTDMKAQILFFGVPIGVMLLYNLVAFVCTVQAIRAAKLGSKHLNRQGSNRSHEIKIYFRLMTIMGFTWFFGLGAHALHQYLIYPFVVFTSLHGVYLAFAFAFKPYVLNLYRNRFTNLSRKSTASTIDLTTSMKGTLSRDAESVL